MGRSTSRALDDPIGVIDAAVSIDLARKQPAFAGRTPYFLCQIIGDWHDAGFPSLAVNQQVVDRLSRMNRFDDVRPFDFADLLSSQSRLGVQSDHQPCLEVFSPDTCGNGALRCRLLGRFLRPLDGRQRCDRIILHLI